MKLGTLQAQQRDLRIKFLIACNNDKEEVQSIFSKFSKEKEPSFYFDEKLELCNSIVGIGKQITLIEKLIDESEEEKNNLFNNGRN